MPWQAWEEFHRNIGTYRVSGGSVISASWQADTDTVAAVTPVVDVMVVADEDLPTTIPAGVDGGTYTRLHFENGLAVFTPGSTFPYPVTGAVGTGDPQYNQNPTTGTALTAVTNNTTWFNVYCIFIPVTADAGSQVYRHVWITGQATYGSLTLAQAEDFRSLNVGNLAEVFTEFLPYVRVSYRRDNSYNNTYSTRLEPGAITYLSGTRSALVTVSGFTPTVHGTLSGRSDPDQHPASAISVNSAGYTGSLVGVTDLSAALAILDTTAGATAVRYTASLSWSGGGPYTMTITGATHGKGVNPMVSVRETAAGVSTVVICDISIDDATGDVTLESTSPITGKVVIS
jgi:hypothetical protein